MELPDDADKIPLVFLARFTIYEDALSGSVKLVITRTAGAADSNSPHVLVLSSAHEIQAQHSISLPLLSTAATSPASAGAVTSINKLRQAEQSWQSLYRSFLHVLVF